MLLNSTTKFFAAFAACASLISYVLIAIISGVSATEYLENMWSHVLGTREPVIIIFITHSSRCRISIPNCDCIDCTYGPSQFTWYSCCVYLCMLHFCTSSFHSLSSHRVFVCAHLSRPFYDPNQLGHLS